jgi:hypothetical protein
LPRSECFFVPFLSGPQGLTDVEDVVRGVQDAHDKRLTIIHLSFRNRWHNKCSPWVGMTTDTQIDTNTSRRSLSLTVLRWSRERVHTTKSIIHDMLRWPGLYDVEAPHLQAALEALEKAEAELNLLN